MVNVTNEGPQEHSNKNLKLIKRERDGYETKQWQKGQEPAHENQIILFFFFLLCPFFFSYFPPRYMYE